jgi:hypothetical protein
LLYFGPRRYWKDQALGQGSFLVLGGCAGGLMLIQPKIRQTNVQEGEAGGITQQIGATYFPLDAIKEKTKVVNKVSILALCLCFGESYVDASFLRTTPLSSRSPVSSSSILLGTSPLPTCDLEEAPCVTLQSWWLTSR